MDQAKSIRKENTFQKLLSRYGIVLVLILIIIVSAIISPSFLKATNLLNIMRQVCVYALLAFAEGILILSGHIDLSAGASCCFFSLLSINYYNTVANAPVAIILAMLTGVALYFVYGIMVAYLDMAPFVVTLAGNLSIRGLCKVYTQGVVITQTGEGFPFMGQGTVGPIPIAMFVMIIACVIITLMLTYSRLGRNLYAVGGNHEAARASGINVKRMRVKAFLIAGSLVGLAGYMFASRINSGVPTGCVGYEGQGISAAIIGGVGFAGGTGEAFGMMIGALIMGVITNILNLMKVDSYVQEVVNGLIILVAVLLDVQLKKRKMRA